jgi:two-component system nitrogen regulation sensor histidine kinase NtrY
MPEVKRIKYQLNKVVKNTLLSYKDNTNGIKIKAHLARIPMIYIDPEQMKRALRNLIDNSIEAMDEMPDGEIDITTRLTMDNSIEIEIKDQGAGIDPAEIDKIFEPYYSKKRKGTGLGLAIVNKVISDHGGGIKVEENKPRGVIVKINLPKGS